MGWLEWVQTACWLLGLLTVAAVVVLVIVAWSVNREPPFEREPERPAPKARLAPLDGSLFWSEQDRRAEIEREFRAYEKELRAYEKERDHERRVRRESE